METLTADRAAWLEAETDRLVDVYRVSCLWYLRRDYYPRTDAERLRVLQSIARHGDLTAFRRAKRLRQWLLQPSNEPSVAP